MWIHGSVATYGDYNSNCVFASAIVLLISNLLHENREDQDLLETAWDLLQMMINQGNAQAAQFLEQLVRLKSNMEDLNSTASGSIDLQMTLNQYRATLPPNEFAEAMGGTATASSTLPLSSNAALDDPRLDEFLLQPNAQWSPDIFGSTEELPYSWINDIDFTNSLNANDGSAETRQT
jgi:hypothetical protein